MQALVAGGGLAGLVKPKGSRNDRRAVGKGAEAAADDEDAAFDRLRRELTFEAKAKVWTQGPTASETSWSRCRKPVGGLCPRGANNEWFICTMCLCWAG